MRPKHARVLIGIRGFAFVKPPILFPTTFKNTIYVENMTYLLDSHFRILAEEALPHFLRKEAKDLTGPLNRKFPYLINQYLKQVVSEEK